MCFAFVFGIKKSKGLAGFPCRNIFLKSEKIDIRVFSRHIIDEILNFILEFFHRINCMQHFFAIVFFANFTRKNSRKIHKSFS